MFHIKYQILIRYVFYVTKQSLFSTMTCAFKINLMMFESICM